MSAEAILANFGGVMWILDTYLRAFFFIFYFGYILRWVSMHYIQDIWKKPRAFCLQSCDFHLFSSPSAALKALQFCSQFGTCLIAKITARLWMNKNLWNLLSPHKIHCSFTWDKGKMSKISRSTLNFVLLYMGQWWDTRNLSVNIIVTLQTNDYFSSLSAPIVMKFFMDDLWYVCWLIKKKERWQLIFGHPFLK